MSGGAGGQGGRGTLRPPLQDRSPTPAPPLPRSPAPWLAVALFRLAGWLAARAPLPAGYWLAAALGEAYFWLNPGHSRHAVDNLAVVLAQERTFPAVRRLARASFRNYAMYLLDFLRLPSTHPTEAERGTLSAGWEHLDAALQGGKGAIVVTAHFGSWDRAIGLVSGRGYRANALVDVFRPPALDAEVRRARARHGLTLIPAEGGAALRQLYGALRRNEVVALLVDRPLREQGTPVTFFGRPTWLPSGPAMLALRTGAPVLVGHFLRRPDLISYQGAFEPLAAPAPTGDRRADERALMQAIVDRLERLIQRHPEQWYMFRPMWPADPEVGSGGDAAGAGAVE